MLVLDGVLVLAPSTLHHKINALQIDFESSQIQINALQ